MMTMVNVLLLLQVIIMMSMVSLVITVMVVMVVTRALCLSWVCALPIPLLRTSKLKQPRFLMS